MASLVGLDASGMDLVNINLYEATLTNADFTNTDLAGANMDLAFLMGATWANTTCPDGTNSNDDGDTCVNNLG